MQGLHITADLTGCGCAARLLIDAAALGDLCRQAVADAGLTRVDETFFTFPEYEGQPGGVTGTVLLAESHLAVHTWPERLGVTLDVYVCNFTDDNSGKAEALMQALVVAFAPKVSLVNRLQRADSSAFEPAPVIGPERGADQPAASSDQPTGARASAQAQGGQLVLEWLTPDTAYGFRATRQLTAEQTAFQKLEVYDTPAFGRLFRLDGRFMTSERDEFFYHEPMVHAAALAHPEPRRALVIGGGDGGAIEELLKHPSMQRVVLAELDEGVVRMAREHLASIHRGAFDDPRVHLHFGDGFAYARDSGERFDLIVLDLTDPDTPAERLYTREFFEMTRRLLNPGGAVSLHIGSPIFQPHDVRRLLADLQQVFAIVRPLGTYVPLYGCYWGMAVASDTLDPASVPVDVLERRLAHRALKDLQLYNAPLHAAWFALPNFFRALLPAATAAREESISI